MHSVYTSMQNVSSFPVFRLGDFPPGHSTPWDRIVNILAHGNIPCMVLLWMTDSQSSLLSDNHTTHRGSAHWTVCNKKTKDWKLSYFGSVSINTKAGHCYTCDPAPLCIITKTGQSPLYSQEGNNGPLTPPLLVKITEFLISNQGPKKKVCSKKDERFSFLTTSLVKNLSRQ